MPAESISMKTLIWVKAKSGDWLSLNTFDLSTISTRFGVYIIWHGGTNPRVVRVGQGDIADRLGCHRDDDEVQAYVGEGLFVTWAAVSGGDADGIERHLADEWRPLVGDRWPVAVPIPVNSPFAA